MNLGEKAQLAGKWYQHKAATFTSTILSNISLNKADFQLIKQSTKKENNNDRKTNIQPIHTNKYKFLRRTKNKNENDPLSFSSNSTMTKAEGMAKHNLKEKNGKETPSKVPRS